MHIRIILIFFFRYVYQVSIHCSYNLGANLIIPSPLILYMLTEISIPMRMLLLWFLKRLSQTAPGVCIEGTLYTWQRPMNIKCTSSQQIQQNIDAQLDSKTWTEFFKIV